MRNSIFLCFLFILSGTFANSICAQDDAILIINPSAAKGFLNIRYVNNATTKPIDSVKVSISEKDSLVLQTSCIDSTGLFHYS